MYILELSFLMKIYRMTFLLRFFYYYYGLLFADIKSTYRHENLSIVNHAYYLIFIIQNIILNFGLNIRIIGIYHENLI